MELASPSSKDKSHQKRIQYLFFRNKIKDLHAACFTRYHDNSRKGSSDFAVEILERFDVIFNVYLSDSRTVGHKIVPFEEKAVTTSC